MNETAPTNIQIHQIVITVSHFRIRPIITIGNVNINSMANVFRNRSFVNRFSPLPIVWNFIIYFSACTLV